MCHGQPINAPIYFSGSGLVRLQACSRAVICQRVGVLRVGHIRSVARPNRYRLMTWIAIWSVSVVVLSLAVSLAFWRGVSIETELTVTTQVDYENAALCAKFGFARGTDEHAACKLDLLDLRRRHEELLAATRLP